MTLPSLPTIKYLEPDQAPFILYALVKEMYGDVPEDALPDYSREDKGAVAGVLEQIQNDDYYPELYDKAAHLFTHLVTSHIFSNGNKRLAFVTLILFLGLNGLGPKDHTGGTKLRTLAIELADNRDKGRANHDEDKAKTLAFLQQEVKQYKSK